MAQVNSEHFLSGGAIVNEGSNGFFEEGRTAQNFYEMLNSNKMQNNNSPSRYNGGSEMMFGREFSPPHFAGAVKSKHAD